MTTTAKSYRREQLDEYVDAYIAECSMDLVAFIASVEPEYFIVISDIEELRDVPRHLRAEVLDSALGWLDDEDKTPWVIDYAHVESRSGKTKRVRALWRESREAVLSGKFDTVTTDAS